MRVIPDWAFYVQHYSAPDTCNNDKVLQSQQDDAASLCTAEALGAERARCVFDTTQSLSV